MKIIIALGNPGEKYAKSRHNAGWIFLDSLLDNPNWKEEAKFKSLVYKEGDLIFVKPLTYMNNSGYSVRKIMDYYKILPKKLGLFSIKDQDLTESLIVIHDELDLEFEKIKKSSNSGSAGHKGVASIISHLKTKNFNRLRIGIKNDLLKSRIPAENFVLQNFSKEEYEELIKTAKNYSIQDLI